MRREQGVISTWNTEKGYGFITPNLGGKAIFIHIKELPVEQRKGQLLHSVVTYLVSTDHRGRVCAIKAELAMGNERRVGPKMRFPQTVSVVAFFVSILGVLSARGTLTPAVPALYVLASLITYLAYAKDKSAAQTGGWRTAESTLHALALAGGWPGALIAQQRLRHKSRKLSFKLVCWATVLLNCIALAWLFTPEGAGYVHLLLQSVL